MLCTHKTTILCQFGLFCHPLTTISPSILNYISWELYHDDTMVLTKTTITTLPAILGTNRSIRPTRLDTLASTPPHVSHTVQSYLTLAPLPQSSGTRISSLIFDACEPPLSSLTNGGPHSCGYGGIYHALQQP